MADDIDITPGVGKTVKTDECGGKHVQIMKLAISTDGDATPIPADATYGLGVDVKRVSGNVPVIGPTAHDAAVSTAPVLEGGYAKSTAPTDVANGDVVNAWNLLNGARAVEVTAAGALIPGDAANGLDVDVTRLPALAAGTNNIGDVDVLTLPAPLGAPGATSVAKAEDAVSADGDVGIPAMAVRKGTPANTSGTDGDYEMLQMSAGRLWVSATVDAALPAGTNAIGKLAANSGVDIGDVDVTSLTGGTIAHDGVDSGNPIKVGARAAALAASVTLVAVADRTDNVSDLDGGLITRPYCQLGDLISDVKTNTDGAATAFTGSFAATANVRNYITTLTAHNSSATAITVLIQDGSGGTTIWAMTVPAGGGSNVSFAPPLRQPTVNTALAFDGSAAATTLTVCANGFKSKA